MTSNSLSKQDVIKRAESLDFPTSVVEFFQGFLGQPVGGFPEPLRTHVIRKKVRMNGRPGADMEPLDFRKIKTDLRSKFGKHITDSDVTSYVMYPKVSLHNFGVTVRLMSSIRYLRNIKGSSRSMET
jgi:pyruvate carboxylase